jgi:hypothetical protein
MEVPAEFILILVSAFIVVRFWKAAVFLFLCALVVLTLLGMVQAAGFFAH